MRDDEVPDHGLEFFGVGRDRIRGDGGNDEAGIGYLRGVAAVASNDAENTGAGRAGDAERSDEIEADAAFSIAAADGENKHGVAGADVAAGEPVGVAGVPAVVVDASRELGDVVGRRVGLDAGDLAEVVDGVAGVACAPADAEEEDASTAVARFHQMLHERVDGLQIEPGGEARDFAEVAAPRPEYE